MSPSGFVHLQVASGYSLQYGASHPHTLVERAVEYEMDTLALTDRDGTYGAVKFAKACLSAGIRPVLGVNLAVTPTNPGLTSSEPNPIGATSYDVARVAQKNQTQKNQTQKNQTQKNQTRRSPARGGAFRDPVLPRVTFLAHAGANGGQAGWAAICRLVSATHLAGERGSPVADLALLRPHLESGDVLVLLGPASEVGMAATRRRDDLAIAALEPWREMVPHENLFIALVSHRLPHQAQSWGPGTSPHAARMAGIARQAGVKAVLTNAVRYADRRDAPIVDVLDAARRLVALDRRHVDRGNAEGFLKSGKQMHEIAEEICRLSGIGDSEGEARRLLAQTRMVADRCALDPRSDLGLGEVHFPEFGLGSADAALRARCEAAIGDRYGSTPRIRIWKRLDDELETIRSLGYASYFLTVSDITDLIKTMGIRSAARGSGAGSLVNYLLGVSGVDPIRHNLLMERFLSPLRQALPDIDIDVESARRLEIYQAILDRYGAERCVCVSMMDTYRVRHAVRDVGAALGMPPGETDTIAKAFPHIRARDARVALRELPELRASGLAEERLDLMFRLVERLDGLPRHIAVHPCGVLLSDATLLDRTPVEASFAGFPMSQFDKDDVEDLGLLKLDVLGIRMQSSMAHAVAEIRRVEGVEIDLDDQAQVPFDDPDTYALISSAKTLGIFQIESPGQRELVGKSGIESFEDIITDISLFRPGPVKSDMITPYLDVKQGWKAPKYLHDDLRPILGPTHGVVVFHEQVIELIAQFTGLNYAEADEKRRALGDFAGMAETKLWFFPRALGRGYSLMVVEGIWKILEAFASFGFCKAHAAAFALPTYQSAWLKTHWPAYFMAGVLTHDPGMYPKRLILEDVRQCGIEVLGIDVNASKKEYVVEKIEYQSSDSHPAIRLALAEVKGINEAEIARIVAARPYHSLTDFWHRAQPSRPILERLVLVGAFDNLYGIGSTLAVRRRSRITRRDLLLQVAQLDLHARALQRAGRAGGLGARRRIPNSIPSTSDLTATAASGRNSSDPLIRAAAQSKATPPPQSVNSVQMTLDLGDEPGEGEVSGLPELSDEERMRAELEILGLDVSRHVIETYSQFLDDLGVTRSRDLLNQRSRSQLLVAGVKVATQTPPIRSGRRVIFLTLDDATGPVDATFFEDAQGPYAATVFGSWLLVVRGELRRTGRRGVSVRATGAWALPELFNLFQAAGGREDGLVAVRAEMQVVPVGFTGVGIEVPTDQPTADSPTSPAPKTPAGGMGRRRVLVHSSGYQVSPYSDVKPAGDSTKDVARKLWHRSPGSPG